MLRKFTDIINEETHEFGCLMAELSFEQNNWMTDVLKLIDENDLYIVGDGYGLEFEPHITILYGLHSNEIKDNNIITNCKSIMSEFTGLINLQNISIFENDDFDVVKFDIENNFLINANAYLKNNYPYTTKFSDYHAHCTIAYVKKGTGYKYIQTLPKPIVANSNVFLYSKPNGEKIRIVK